MGLFHQTIRDIQSMVEEGRYDEAKRVLDEHISAYHGFNSDLTSLMRATATFQQRLMDFQNHWPYLFQTPTITQKSLPEFHERCRELRLQLNHISDLLNKLLKEQKFTLE